MSDSRDLAPTLATALFSIESATVHSSQARDTQPIRNGEISSECVKQKALELGFHKVGIVTVEEAVGAEVQRLQAWLALGYQADMKWMANHKRQDIRTVMPEVRSLVCVALNYYTPDKRPDSREYAKISRYGWGRDYHKVLQKKLKALTDWLLKLEEGIQARYYADTGPVQDKAWAQRAGIGWLAKNGNVITREYGSWVFLGEVLTNLNLTPDQPHTEHCGSCTRCLDACPTGAITQPFVIDANRCIAYHTIENRAEKLPDAIAPHLQGWVAGCDICQDVCPWNQRFAKETDVAEFQPYPKIVAPTLTELAEISDEEWSKRFPASALRRIKPDMLRRNARANLVNTAGVQTESKEEVCEDVIKTMSAKVIIFDFDGTIADTIDAIVSISNNLATEFGYQQTSQEELAQIRNFTPRQIIQRAGISIHKLPFLARKVKLELNKEIREINPIPGITEALIQLKDRDNRLGIITSNSKENVVAFLEKNQLEEIFSFVYSGRTLFGKNKVITNLIKRENLDPEAVIYVGDEVRDIEAARKSQIKAIAVTWGFNSREVLSESNPDILIDSPTELVEAVEKGLGYTEEVHPNRSDR